MEIGRQLQKNKRSLKDFKAMPYPKDFILSILGNRLIYDGRQYDPVAQNQNFQHLYTSLTGKVNILSFHFTFFFLVYI